MELTVTQENLSKALNIVSRIANMKTQLPILDNILVKTEGNRLLIASTNLEIATTEHIGAKIIKAGSITIPAKVVTEFVNNLPSGVVSLKVINEKNLTIESGKFKSVINGVIADDFPELPTIDETSAIKYVIKVASFKEAISQTIISSSNDLSRPILTGVLWQVVEGSLYFVSTDGYRLSEKRVMKSTEELSVVIPTQTLQEVMRAISDATEEIEVLFSESQVRFRVDETEIISQLIDGKFPDYRQLIPKSNEVKVLINKADFMQVSKISGLFASHSSSGVTITADEDNNIISLKSIASEIGENTSEAEAKVIGNGKITLNSRYLIDVLSIIDAKEVSFEFNSKISPCVIKSNVKDPDYTHIIMPLKS